MNTAPTSRIGRGNRAWIAQMRARVDLKLPLSRKVRLFPDVV